MHSEPFDRLASHYPPQQCRQILSEWWSITDRTSAQQTCEWLREAGHTAVAREVLQQGMDLAPQQGQPAVVGRNRSEIERIGLAAWDIGRLSVVIRWCSTAGFISEQEAWGSIEAELDRIQQSYASWDEFGHAWRLGFEFWSNDGALDQHFVRAFHWLASHQESPWRRLVWDSDLAGN
jgi:hypothetical protein